MAHMLEYVTVKYDKSDKRHSRIALALEDCEIINVRGQKTVLQERSVFIFKTFFLFSELVDNFIFYPKAGQSLKRKFGLIWVGYIQRVIFFISKQSSKRSKNDCSGVKSAL